MSLSVQDKQDNRRIASQRMLNEHVIVRLKRFKIISDRYQNRRKRFGLRFNLIAGISNFEVIKEVLCFLKNPDSLPDSHSYARGLL